MIGGAERQAFPTVEDAITTVVGIGVIIILNEVADLHEQNIRILTVKEKERKDETGREEGCRGIVQETIKVDLQTGQSEHTDATLLGAMEELVTPEIGAIGKNFHRVLFPERIETPLRTLGEGIEGGIEIVVFTGDGITAPKNSEVTDLKFMKVTDFLVDQLLRPTSGELVRFAIEKKLLSFGLQQYRNGLTVPVFPSEIQFEEFLVGRNKQPDITKFQK